MNRKIFSLISVFLVAGFILAACATEATPEAAEEAPAEEAVVEEAAEEPAAEEVTITWWHISTKDPALTDWQNMADAYMAEHPNVNIEITVLENEAFKTKLTTVLQSGEVPDIFQSWGGGTLKEQIDAGLLKDITQILMLMAAHGAIHLPPVLWPYSARMVKTTAFRGTWAWLDGGTTKISLQKLALPQLHNMDGIPGRCSETERCRHYTDISG